jgi:2-polyprenyl-3-methyl-5-hydroxy-6-metoxy-1,4-benzoquinol methylase
MQVTAANIDAFQRATRQLAPDEIAGFLRYEVDSSGNRSLPDVHAAFRWKPESVRRRGSYTIAEFTNEHAGFYILTQSQLRRALASGGFLKGPCQGRYGLPETAATDPYTSCGFRKVICISALEEFLIHHMSNVYVGRYGIPFSAFMDQVQTLMAIRDGSHPASTLGPVEPKALQRTYSKASYEAAQGDLLALVPREAKTILSIGCGWGGSELALQQRGARITALPLDSVIGAVAARLGIEVIYGTWKEGVASLADRRFDCVFISNLLHLQRDPGQVLEQCAGFLSPEGTIVIGGPNFVRLPCLIKRLIGVGQFRCLRSFEASGISLCGPRSLAPHLKQAGLHPTVVQWADHALPKAGPARSRLRFGPLTARHWALQARKNHC